jgi:hypothetical protein
MPTTPAWRLRDSIAATGLFLATAAFTLWQNTRVAVLWDLTYLLDSSWRISLGQVPYRDFPFAHAPLTFLLHAAIIHAFGRVYFPHILCAALEGGAATLLTWRILLKLTGTWPVALLLATPLTFLGIYGIYPHPVYDSDAILAVLFALYLLQRASPNRIANVFTGAACVVPLFFKQNIGLFFLLAALGAVAALAVLRRRQYLSITPQFWLMVGAAAALASALLAIHATAGLHNYLYWTITFARQRRLPGLAVVLSIYRQTSLLWTIPAVLAALFILPRKIRGARHTAILLLAAPFLWTMATLALSSDAGDRADQLLSLWPHLLVLSAALALWNLHLASRAANPSLNMLLPIILLVTIHGTFLSQQLWGSTYAIWPLLTLLVAALLAQIHAIARPVTIVIAATFLINGSLYAVSHERLSYIRLDGERAHATLPSLLGLATPGPWIPGFEELVRVTNAEIPPNDGILLVPGEDPLYFATGRTPQFPILLFDPATDPYTPQETRDQARDHNIRWLILDTNPQLAASPYDQLPAITAALLQDFVPYRTLTNFTIYRRR